MKHLKTEFELSLVWDHGEANVTVFATGVYQKPDNEVKATGSIQDIEFSVIDEDGYEVELTAYEIDFIKQRAVKKLFEKLDN